MGGLTPDRIAELYSAGQMIMLAAGRSLGFALIFSAFAWGKLNSGLLRMVFGLMMALPVMAPLWLVSKTTIDMLPTPFVLLMVKELFLGVLMGFLMSLPFEALGIAGGIVDIYRGSGSPLQSPSGELTPFAQIFMVVALWLFASLGGFWIVMDVIYSSYAMWPLLEPLPSLSMDGLTAFFHFLTQLLKLALIIAGPMLALLGAVDLVFAVAAKIGKSLNVTYLSMGVKSLVAVIALPPFAMVLVRVISGEIKALSAIEPMLRAAIR